MEPESALSIVTASALEHARTLDKRSQDPSRTQAERDRDVSEALEIRDAVSVVDPDW